MKKFTEKQFENLTEALDKALEIKKFLNSLGFKNHFIIKEIDTGYILEIWFESMEKQLWRRNTIQ